MATFRLIGASTGIGIASPSLRRTAALLLLCSSLLGCAHLSGSAAQQQQQQLFQAGLHASVAVATQSLVAFHPDVVPHLLAWLDAICGTVTGATSIGALQTVMLGTLDATAMPPTMHAILADFIPVVIALMPIALQTAEIAVPEVASVLIVAGDVCRWVGQAIPASVRVPITGQSR